MVWVGRIRSVEGLEQKLRRNFAIKVEHQFLPDFQPAGHRNFRLVRSHSHASQSRKINFSVNSLYISVSILLVLFLWKTPIDSLWSPSICTDNFNLSCTFPNLNLNFQRLHWIHI